MDEIESVQHYIKYVSTKPGVDLFELYDAVMKLTEIGNKFALNGYNEEEISKLINLDDMKEVVISFIEKIQSTPEPL
jgi:hypothetical protein